MSMLETNSLVFRPYVSSTNKSTLGYEVPWPSDLDISRTCDDTYAWILLLTVLYLPGLQAR